MSYQSIKMDISRILATIRSGNTAEEWHQYREAREQMFEGAPGALSQENVAYFAAKAETVAERYAREQLHEEVATLKNGREHYLERQEFEKHEQHLKNKLNPHSQELLAEAVSGLSTPTDAMHGTISNDPESQNRTRG